MKALPKCKTAEDCDKIAYIVRKTPENFLKQDIFICSTCMASLYSAEHCELIPDIDSIVECLEHAKFNINRISAFKDQFGLEEAWDGLLVVLDKFKEDYDQFRARLESICDHKQWELLAQFQIDARHFLNQIFDSDLMKSFTRQLQFRSYKEVKLGVSFEGGDSQARLRVKLEEQRQTMKTQEILPLREELKNASERLAEGEALKERLNQEKTELEQRVQTLVQEKDELISQHEQSSIQSQQQIQELNTKIQTLTEEDNNRNAQFEEMKTQITNLEACLGEAKYSLSHPELKMILDSIRNGNYTVNNLTSLTFDLNNVSHQNALKALQLFRLPRLNQIHLNYVDSFNSPEVMANFMANAFRPAADQQWSSVNQFVFSNATNDWTKEVGPYIPALKKVFPVIRDFIRIYYLKLSKTEFEDLVVAAKHCKTIKMGNCNIETDEEVGFGDRLDDSTFTKLDFHNLGSSSYGSNWKQNGFNRFKSIIKGLAKVCQIKNRQISIDLSSCDLSKDLAESVLQDNGMTKMTIEGL
ncbi:unnamed protein product [Moneuplotes crassus]|uniref:Uncharacterized protein n=1 Tax=Euplotes crassus TaxID=5936 RepID=A0AAD1U6B7_EUPCR|nr:unnamed protein product [Moneuplotes crassus]